MYTQMYLDFGLEVALPNFIAIFLFCHWFSIYSDIPFSYNDIPKNLSSFQQKCVTHILKEIMTHCFLKLELVWLSSIVKYFMRKWLQIKWIGSFIYFQVMMLKVILKLMSVKTIRWHPAETFFKLNLFHCLEWWVIWR